MQQHAHEMMRTGVQTEHLDVEHVGRAGERMPHKVVTACKNFNHTVPGKALRDERVVGQVNIVILVDEAMFSNRREKDECNQRK